MSTSIHKLERKSECFLNKNPVFENSSNHLNKISQISIVQIQKQLISQQNLGAAATSGPDQLKPLTVMVEQQKLLQQELKNGEVNLFRKWRNS